MTAEEAQRLYNERQAAYAALRAAVTGRTPPPMLSVRIVMADGAERVERFASLAKAAEAYPEAWRVERCDKAGFW